MQSKQKTRSNVLRAIKVLGDASCVEICRYYFNKDGDVAQSSCRFCLIELLSEKLIKVAKKRPVRNGGNTYRLTKK